MHCDLDLWPFDLKIYRAHPWLMGSLHVKFHNDRCKGKAVMRRKPKCGRQTDGRTDMVIPVYPPNFVAGGGGINMLSAVDLILKCGLPLKCDYQTDGQMPWCTKWSLQLLQVTLLGRGDIIKLAFWHVWFSFIFKESYIIMVFCMYVSTIINNFLWNTDAQVGCIKQIFQCPDLYLDLTPTHPQR